MQRIAVIGLGLIGGSIAKALKQSNLKIEIAGFDRDTVMAQAISDKVIDRKLSAIEESSEYDIIFVCLPVAKSIKVIEQLAPILNSDTILTDVCSIKGKIKDLVNESLCKALYIGGHPMTGKEKGGYENSDPLQQCPRLLPFLQPVGGEAERRWTRGRDCGGQPLFT